MNIRPYSEANDFEEVARWARVTFNGKAPRSTQFSETSFVAEEEKMAGVLSIMLTNCKDYCLLDCLFTNPDLAPRIRGRAIAALAKYAELFAEALQYKGLFCWTENKAMARHYNRLGFKVTAAGAYTLYKVIGGA